MQYKGLFLGLLTISGFELHAQEMMMQQPGMTSSIMPPQRQTRMGFGQGYAAPRQTVENVQMDGGINVAFQALRRRELMNPQVITSIDGAVNHARMYPSTGKATSARCEVQFRAALWGKTSDSGLQNALKICDPNNIRNYLAAVLKSNPQYQPQVFINALITNYNTRASAMNVRIDAENAKRQQAAQIKAQAFQQRQQAVMGMGAGDPNMGFSDAPTGALGMGGMPGAAPMDATWNNQINNPGMDPNMGGMPPMDPSMSGMPGATTEDLPPE